MPPLPTPVCAVTSERSARLGPSTLPIIGAELISVGSSASRRSSSSSFIASRPDFSAFLRASACRSTGFGGGTGFGSGFASGFGGSGFLASGFGGGGGGGSSTSFTTSSGSAGGGGRSDIGIRGIRIPNAAKTMRRLRAVLRRRFCSSSSGVQGRSKIR